MTPIANDLANPLPLPSLQDELKDFTDPDAIANCRDPLRRVAMVMVALSMAEADSLNEEVKDITSDTDAIADTNELMRMMNDASARAKLFPLETQSTYIIQDQPIDKFNDVAIVPYISQACINMKARLSAAGIDPATIAISSVYSKALTYDPYTGQPNLPLDANGNGQLVTYQLFQVTMEKKSIEAATKNLQTRIEDLSSTTQQKQLFMQTLMGKFNGTYEVATAGLKKMAEMNDVIAQNFKR